MAGGTAAGMAAAGVGAAGGFVAGALVGSALAAPYYPYGYYGRIAYGGYPASLLRPAVRVAALVERLHLGARLRLSALAKLHPPPSAGSAGRP